MCVGTFDESYTEIGGINNHDKHPLISQSSIFLFFSSEQFVSLLVLHKFYSWIELPHLVLSI